MGKWYGNGTMYFLFPPPKRTRKNPSYRFVPIQTCSLLLWAKSTFLSPILWKRSSCLPPWPIPTETLQAMFGDYSIYQVWVFGGGRAAKLLTQIVTQTNHGFPQQCSDWLWHAMAQSRGVSSETVGLYNYIKLRYEGQAPRCPSLTSSRSVPRVGLWYCSPLRNHLHGVSIEKTSLGSIAPRDDCHSSLVWIHCREPLAKAIFLTAK